MSPTPKQLAVLLSLIGLGASWAGAASGGETSGLASPGVAVNEKEILIRSVLGLQEAPRKTEESAPAIARSSKAAPKARPSVRVKTSDRVESGKWDRVALGLNASAANIEASSRAKRQSEPREAAQAEQIARIKAILGLDGRIDIARVHLPQRVNRGTTPLRPALARAPRAPTAEHAAPSAVAPIAEAADLSAEASDLSVEVSASLSVSPFERATDAVAEAVLDDSPVHKTPRRERDEPLPMLADGAAFSSRREERPLPLLMLLPTPPLGEEKAGLPALPEETDVNRDHGPNAIALATPSELTAEYLDPLMPLLRSLKALSAQQDVAVVQAEPGLSAFDTPKSTAIKEAANDELVQVEIVRIGELLPTVQVSSPETTIAVASIELVPPVEELSPATAIALEVGEAISRPEEAMPATAIALEVQPEFEPELAAALSTPALSIPALPTPALSTPALPAQLLAKIELPKTPMLLSDGDFTWAMLPVVPIARSSETEAARVAALASDGALNSLADYDAGKAFPGNERLNAALARERVAHENTALQSPRMVAAIEAAPIEALDLVAAAQNIDVLAPIEALELVAASQNVNALASVDFDISSPNENDAGARDAFSLKEALSAWFDVFDPKLDAPKAASTTMSAVHAARTAFPSRLAAPVFEGPLLALGDGESKSAAPAAFVQAQILPKLMIEAARPMTLHASIEPVEWTQGTIERAMARRALAVSAREAELAAAFDVQDEDRANPLEGQSIALADSKLDQLRGGFETDSGLKISFGIERAVYINGNLVTTTSLNVADLSKLTAGQAQAAGLNNASLGVIQNGPNNSFLPGQVSASSVATVVQNTLNNQKIQGVTLINATVNSLDLIKRSNVQSSIQNALTDSIRR